LLPRRTSTPSSAELPKRRTKAQRARLAELFALAEPLPPERAYLDFAVHVERARAEAEVALVALITRASREDWRAAAWLLERSKPQRWGRRDNVTLDVGVNADGAPGATDPVELADAGHDMLRRMIADEDERDAAPVD
jgi:hypothetical protein